tara:strand:- start:395853 stop:396077 length:225 start_codon:yes stop_codon:yes gene_type:complete
MGKDRDMLSLFNRAAIYYQEHIEENNLPIDSLEKCTSYTIKHKREPSEAKIEYSKGEIKQLKAKVQEHKMQLKP